jgi:hypothetical protein
MSAKKFIQLMQALKKATPTFLPKPIRLGLPSRSFRDKLVLLKLNKGDSVGDSPPY